MEFWKDAMEAVTMFQKLWIEVIKDPVLGPSVKKLDSLMVFDYSEDGAGAKLWVDLRGGKGETGIGEPPDNPNLTLSTSADLGHKAWSNKFICPWCSLRSYGRNRDAGCITEKNF